MTRKRFWGLRNAFSVRLNEWAKANGLPVPSGVCEKKMRPVSGKPLVNFEKGEELGFGTSYKECWNSSGMTTVRKGLGM